ncbi:MAG: hypothetical protein KBD94_02610 [Pyrinomonadaceae bacterium]|nr:hypothetical protein [Pyrinomonadaceae bacterium]
MVNKFFPDRLVPLWPKMIARTPENNFNKTSIFVIFRLTNASRLTILSFASEKKEFRGKRLCSISRDLETGDLFFEKTTGVINKMKKVIALSTVLGLSALGMACGETPANNATNKPANTAPAASPVSSPVNTAPANTAANHTAPANASNTTGAKPTNAAPANNAAAKPANK